MTDGRVSRVAAAALAIASLATAAACPERGEAPGQPDIRTGERPREGGTLRALLVEDADSLDPHRATRPSSWFFARALHRGLLAPSTDTGAPREDLATMRVDRTGLRYTFAIRAGVRFGPPASRPVGAADAKASIERLIRTGLGIAPFLDVISGAPAVASGRARRVSGIRATGARTLTVRLRRRVNDLPALLAHPQAAIVPAGTPLRSRGAATIAGAGPYRIRSYAPERSLVIERNPAWARASDPVRPAYVDEIRATIGVRASAARDRVARGDADVVVEPGAPEAWADIAFPADARVEQAGDGCLRYLFLNPRVPPLNRVAVRRAVAQAVQRASLAPEGRARTAERILGPGIEGHRTEPVLREDVDGARRSLARAGLARGFTLRMLVARSGRDEGEARALARSLARIRVRLDVRSIRPSILYTNPGNWRTAMSGIATWCADWSGSAGRGVLGVIADPRAGSSSPTPVPRGAAGRAIARAIDRAARAPSARAPALWADADRLAVRYASIVPIAWGVERVALAERVRGWTGTLPWIRGDPAALWVAG